MEREEKGKSSTFRELVSRLIRPITNSLRRKREIVKRRPLKLNITKLTSEKK